MEEKKITIFDFMANLTDKKVKWDTYTESDIKQFSPYMINRWFSQHYNLTELVNEFQRYTIGLLEKREVYKLYFGILPKSKFFSKYIKSSAENKYNEKLIQIFKTYFELGTDDVFDYLEIMARDENGIEQIILILKKYGIDDKEIKKLLKK